MTYIGSLLHLVIDPAQVFADDADHEQLHATQQQNDHERRCPPSDGVAADEPLIDRPDSERMLNADAVNPRYVAMRSGTRENPTMPLIPRPSDLRNVYFGSPANLRRPLERHGGLPESQPRPQPAQISIALGHAVEQVDHATVHQAEIAGVCWNVTSVRRWSSR